MRDELLKQNGRSAVEEELSRLRQSIEAERRRGRQLGWLTLGVWLLWALMLSAGLVLPMVAYQRAQKGAGTAATQPVPRQTVDEPLDVFGVILGTVVFALLFLLPVAGVILAVMFVISRRTVSTNQLQLSLASIESQLRILAMDKGQGHPKQGG
jgi:hypothetical protein